MKRLVHSLLGAVLSCAALSFPASASETFVFNFETGLGSRSVQRVRTLEAWSAAVEKASRGRIRIHLYPSGSLARPNVNLTACQDGLVDIAYLHSFFFTDRLKALETLYVPGLNISDPRAASLAVWELMERHPAFHDEAKGVKILGVHVSPMVIGSVTGPVMGVDDFDGLRLRTNGKSTAVLAEHMGATVMTVPGPDIFMNLQKKIVEAAVAAWEGHRGFGLTGLCTSFTEGDFLPPIYFYLVINRHRWDALPPDLQKVLEEQSGARFAALGGETEAFIAADVKAELAREGKKVLMLSGKERERMDRVCAEVRERELARMEKEGVADARRYVAEFLELMKKHETR